MIRKTLTAMAVITMLAVMLQVQPASAASLFSPAGCQVNVNKPTESWINDKEMIFDGRLNCAYGVQADMQLWGDHIAWWGGWGQWTPKPPLSTNGSANIFGSIHMNCKLDNHKYRTRATAQSYEGGYVYSASVASGQQHVKGHRTNVFWLDRCENSRWWS